METLPICAKCIAKGVKMPTKEVGAMFWGTSYNKCTFCDGKTKAVYQMKKRDPRLDPDYRYCCPPRRFRNE